MSELRRACEFNEIAGTKRKYRKLDECLSSMDLLKEEYQETIDAFEADDRIGVLDGLGDMLVVIAGFLHRMGVSPDRLMRIINDSNDSKFVYTRDDAIKSVLAYEDSDVYENVHYVEYDGRYVIFGSKKGSDLVKILKGIHYEEPDLRIFR